MDGGGVVAAAAAGAAPVTSLPSVGGSLPNLLDGVDGGGG